MTPTAPSSRRFPLRLSAWLIAAALLAAPAVAMQFTHEVAWTAPDFSIAALLLFGGLTLVELFTRRIADRRRRTAIAALLLGAVLLVWVNGAVGIIGDEGNSANRVVPIVALVGVVIAALLARAGSRT